MTETSHRRVLSEIASPKNNPRSPKRRRNSLGFSMVKIVTSPKPSKMNHRGSFIPVLKPDSEKQRSLSQRLSFEAFEKPRGLSQRLSFETSDLRSSVPDSNSYISNDTENHFGDSQYLKSKSPSSGRNTPEIPRPWAEIPASNADKYKRLLSINNNLNLKTRITSSDGGSRKYGQLSPKIGVHENESAYTDELIRENEKLDVEIAQAEVALASVEEETVQFRLLYKALKTEVRELEKTISESEGRFEFLSNQITKKVEREEHEINQKLQKIRSEKDEFLRESRFEVENEVKSKLENDDTEVLEARQTMQAELEAVRAQLDAFLDEKASQIALERRNHEKEIQRLSHLAKNDTALEKKRAELALLQEKLDTQAAEVAKMQETQESVDREIQKAEKAVFETLKQSQDCDAQELTLRARISSGGRNLEELLALSRSSEARFRQAEAEFGAENEKYQKYLYNRRSLEFSIMSYKQKYDIMVIPERLLGVFSVSDYCTVTMGQTRRDFSKVVIVGTENALSVSEMEVFNEYELLISERAQISKAKSVFFRFFGSPPDLGAIFKSLERENGEIYVQSVGIKDGVLIDLLSEKAVELEEGAKKVVSEQKRLASTEYLELVPSSSQVSVHIFTTAKRDTVYVASIPEKEQHIGSQLMEALRAVVQNSTVVNVCDIRNSEGNESSLQNACLFCDQVQNSG